MSTDEKYKVMKELAKIFIAVQNLNFINEPREDASSIRYKKNKEVKELKITKQSSNYIVKIPLTSKEPKSEGLGYDSSITLIIDARDKNKPLKLESVLNVDIEKVTPKLVDNEALQAAWKQITETKPSKCSLRYDGITYETVDNFVSQAKTRIEATNIITSTAKYYGKVHNTLLEYAIKQGW